MRRFLDGGAVALAVLVIAGAACAQPRPVLKRAYDTDGKSVRAVFAASASGVRASTVRLEAGGEPTALGLVVSDDGQLLTKASELRDAAGDPRAVTGVLADGRRVSARVLALDPRADLALLQLEGAPATTPVAWPEPAQVGAGGIPPLGRWVVVPGLDAVPLAVGVVSTQTRDLPPVRLGLVFFTDERRERMVVTQVQEDMGAATAGVKTGDVLIALDGGELRVVQDIRERLLDRGVGDTLELVVERDGEQLALAVTLMNRPVNLTNRTDFMNLMGNGVSRRRDGFERVFQHDAAMTPAQCGGPLVDLDGRLVGVNIARAGRVESFALPVEDVVAALGRLRRQAAAEGQNLPGQ